jgi:hypothetical protein
MSRRLTLYATNDKKTKTFELQKLNDTTKLTEATIITRITQLTRLTSQTFCYPVSSIENPESNVINGINDHNDHNGLVSSIKNRRFVAALSILAQITNLRFIVLTI